MPSAEGKKEQVWHLCKEHYQKNRGTVRWNVVVSFAMCTTKWPMASQPFGTLVEYTPITAKDKSRVHQFGQKTLRGVLRASANYLGIVFLPTGISKSLTFVVFL